MPSDRLNAIASSAIAAHPKDYRKCAAEVEKAIKKEGRADG